MYGFPPILDGNAGVKMTRDADSGFPKPGIREIFYSIKDGNWTDITVWQTASGRVGLLPTANDDVYVRHTIAVNTNATINGLYVSGRLTINSSFTLSLNDKFVGAGNSTLINAGTLNFLTQISAEQSYSFGLIDFTTNANTVAYTGNYSATIPSYFTTFSNLLIAGTGNKTTSGNITTTAGVNVQGGITLSTLTLGGDLTVGTNLTVNATMQLAASNLTVSGTTSFGVAAAIGTMFKSGAGNVLFVGAITQGGNTSGTLIIDFSLGNPTVECRGGISLGFVNAQGPLTAIKTGTGQWSFTTNNQTIGYGGGAWEFDAPILIGNGITLTVSLPSAQSSNFNNVINGGNATSKLLNASNSTITFTTQIAAQNSMTTGIADFTTNVNTVVYGGNYSATIPSLFPTFHNLIISGTGAKTLGVNTTLNGNLACLVNSTLECSTSNLTVSGTTAIGGSSVASGLLSKNGAGNILFVGNVNLQVNGSGQRGFDFSGNPNVEFRGGITVYTLTGWNTGNGVWTFTTNSQTINLLASAVNVLDCSVLISGAINLTISNGTITANNIINGNNAASKLINTGALFFGTATAATSIMTTGQYDFTTSVNTVGFTGNYSATIPSKFTAFSSLYISGTGIKTVSVDTVLNANLSVGTNNTLATLELSTFNLTVNGTTNIGVSSSNGALLSKTGSGNILLIGAVVCDVNFSSTLIGLNFTGNPTVELRGGFTFFQSGGVNKMNTGTGIWTLNGNQTIVSRTGNAGDFACPFVVINSSTVTLTAPNTSLVFNNTITISGASTVLVSQTGGAAVTLNSTINGTTAASTLRMTTSGILNFATAASVSSMTTGIIDFTTNANTIGYTGNYSATIPSYFTTFSSLLISGTGTKTLGVNTTLNGNLSVASNGTLQLVTFNLSVGGATTITSAGATLAKSGAGNVLFTGLFTMGDAGNTLNFSVGNPTVECRGGMNFGPFATTFSTGTGQWTFSTANQTINFGNYLATFDCPILINGAIDVTITGSGLVTARGGVFNNTVNGNNVNSKLINRFTIYINTTTAFTGFMSTGILDITTFTNILAYTLNGNATIPYTSFSGLIIRGTGTKTLSNNTTLSAALAVNTNGALELSTFNLSVTGTTTIGEGGTSGNLSKTGTGNIVFGGLFTYSSGSISFTGNPNVELRGGTAIGPFGTFNSGTGTWTFTTASQSFGFTNYDVTFNCNILISGAITVTFTQISVAGTKTVILNGLLNGDNAASTFRMGATTTKLLSYNNTTQPMATGVLDTSTNLNTFIYGAGNQAVKGGPSLVSKQVYRNLTLNGGGVKTLQGYVSVLNTYTLTSPATLALNGFTLTNP